MVVAVAHIIPVQAATPAAVAVLDHMLVLAADTVLIDTTNTTEDYRVLGLVAI
jgi:hypothetical protein